MTIPDNRPFAIRTYSPERLREALKRMYLIRRFEEGAEDSYPWPDPRHHAPVDRARGQCHGHLHGPDR
jgi:hypothetical protein